MLPKPPKVKELPAPSRTDASIQEAADQQRQRALQDASGTNWLTGGLGVNPKRVQTAAQLLGA